MTYKYIFQGYNKEKMARAVGLSLPISHKHAREICSYLKHRTLDDAKKTIARILDMKEAVPFKRFNMDMGHKPGISAGRYPQIATAEILKIIESAEKNANNKGLSDNLYITHIAAHKAPASPRSGRTPGESKRAHVEIVIEEKKVEEKTEKSGKNKETKQKKQETKSK